MNVLAVALKSFSGTKANVLSGYSRVTARLLAVIVEHGYISKSEIIHDYRAGEIIFNLTGRLNRCVVTS